MKTDDEIVNQALENCIVAEIKLGQYARHELPLTEICKEVIQVAREGYVRVDDVLKILNYILPCCICKSNQPIDKDCPNELLDGIWSDSLNRKIKREIKSLSQSNSGEADVCIDDAISKTPETSSSADIKQDKVAMSLNDGEDSASLNRFRNDKTAEDIHSQENPKSTAEGVKIGGSNRITPKVKQDDIKPVPEKDLNLSPDNYIHSRVTQDDKEQAFESPKSKGVNPCPTQICKNCGKTKKEHKSEYFIGLWCDYLNYDNNNQYEPINSEGEK